MIQAQAPHYTLVAVAVAVAVVNSEAAVDEVAAVLEDVDMDKGVADDTSHTHQDAPIAAWTTTPPRNAERHPDIPAILLAIVQTPPINAAITVEKVDTSVSIAQYGSEQRKPEQKKHKTATNRPPATTMHMPPSLWQDQTTSLMPLND